MERVSGRQSRRGIGRVPDLLAWARSWEFWSLSGRLRAFILVVICADLVMVAVSAATYRPRTANLELFALLLVCVAATVELTRRSTEPDGVAKDVYAVWELPIVILLPPLYGLVIPAIRLALTQWRVRKSPAHRRIFSVAAISLAYGCGSAVYRAAVPAGAAARGYMWHHAELWLVAAAVCAITQWAVNQALVLVAVKATSPQTRLRDAVFGQDTMRNDVTELCAAILVTLGLSASWLTVIVALPLTTMLQRAFRHDQLLHQARADAKTGLLNAAAWEQLATAEVERAVRTRSPLAVAVLDLDKFKNINDTYGHLLGDEVLRDIAITMTTVLRDYDLAGRFGGEEFVMLLPQTRAVDAFRIAERVREHIAQLPVFADGTSGRERVPVTVSIGVAALDAGTERELTDLLAAADAALYRAKGAGRDQVQMISTSRGLSAVRPPAGDAGLFSAGTVPSGIEAPFNAGLDAVPPDAADLSDLELGVAGLDEPDLIEPGLAGPGVPAPELADTRGDLGLADLRGGLAGTGGRQVDHGQDLGA
ncbi:MAG TPA: GGDEF domain-containing protein [Trebonia sp.]|jgi:diguanylate cyclase (GGDEF)-like protein